MPKLKDIPFSRMQSISESGVFVKRFGRYGKVTMKSYAHRDDYYIIVLLTEGSAEVEIDFERKELVPGDILIVSPWQVHKKPDGEPWQADGWMLAFSAEMLSASEAQTIEEYSISSLPLKPTGDSVDDIVALCSILERYKSDKRVSVALTSAIKSIVLSSLDMPEEPVKGRYRAITLKLRKFLDRHLAEEKSPAAYASMLNISEIYLNEAVKSVTGLSAGAYIRSRVMAQARRQLAYTSLSSKQIAYSLGYEDYAYFSRLFKKHFGKSPSEYRKDLK